MKFPESTIRAVAEQCWYYKIKDKTIAQNNRLTEGELDDLRRTLEYREYVEKIMFERRSAEDFEKWVKSYDRHGGITVAFSKRMGLEPKDVKDIVNRVRQKHLLIR